MVGDNILVFLAITLSSIYFKILHLTVTLKLIEKHRFEEEEEEEEEEEQQEDSGYDEEMGKKIVTTTG